jgi:hypothetical protein
LKQFEVLIFHRGLLGAINDLVPRILALGFCQTELPNLGWVGLAKDESLYHLKLIGESSDNPL